MAGEGKRLFFPLLQNIQKGVAAQPVAFFNGTGRLPKDKADLT
jgi:hypothetical protein